MKHLKILLLIAVFLLSGCKVENSVTETLRPIATSTHTSVPTIEPETAPTLAPTDKPTPRPTRKPNKTTKVSDLFTSIYVPYATREKPWYFSTVKTFAKSCGYTYEVTTPTEEDLGEIKISDSNGDYVYFTFMPSNMDDEIIMTVCFYQKKSNSEVSVNNYSTDGSASYDSFSTHIIGKREKKVSSIDDQKSFLFD